MLRECRNNSRQTDVVIAKKFFYNLYIDNYKINGKNRKKVGFTIIFHRRPKTEN